MRFRSERRIFNSSPIFEISYIYGISDVARLSHRYMTRNIYLWLSDLPSKCGKALSIASEFGDGREFVHTSRSTKVMCHNKLRQGVLGQVRIILLKA